MVEVRRKLTYGAFVAASVLAVCSIRSVAPVVDSDPDCRATSSIHFDNEIDIVRGNAACLQLTTIPVQSALPGDCVAPDARICTTEKEWIVRQK